MSEKKAVLLINLGSPESTSVKDVRTYLREFLSDSRVIDAPTWQRWLVLNLFILPFRPRRSAHAYEKIWTAEGSPLVVVSGHQQQLLQEKVTIPVYLAMRYGNPSIVSVLKDIAQQGISELFVMPLYPHYAMSSFETVVVEVMDQIQLHGLNIKVDLLQPFYRDPEYIHSLHLSAQPYLDKHWDHLLFSFHGIPQRHLRKSDPSHAHCLCTPDCCMREHPAHATCYRSQCYATARAFARAAGIAADRYSVSFQSRLGRDPWITPYTDFVVKELAENGVKQLLVMTPSFVTDCLETLEEVAMTYADDFKAAGGEQLTLVPCLNTHPSWIQFLVNKVADWLHRS
jgi:ferrochelatase